MIQGKYFLEHIESLRKKNQYPILILDFLSHENNFLPVFETDFGYHFLRVTDRRGQVYSACHVLISPKVDPLALAEMGSEMKWTASRSA